MSGFSEVTIFCFISMSEPHATANSSPMPWDHSSLSSSCPREPLLDLGQGNFSQQHGTIGTDLTEVPDLCVSLNLLRPRVSGERQAS